MPLPTTAKEGREEGRSVNGDSETRGRARASGGILRRARIAADGSCRRLLTLRTCNAVGREAIEGLCFLASLPRAGAGREKTQPFNCLHSRLFKC